jgi:hypothetical protein
MFYNYEMTDCRLLKVCLTEQIANRKLKEYIQDDQRFGVEYDIREYDVVEE